MNDVVTGIDRIQLLQLVEDENAQIVDVLPQPEFRGGAHPWCSQHPAQTAHR
ncbi:MAG: hypothetical protein ACRDWA_13815 [Acidimicrobiia bacterium]